MEVGTHKEIKEREEESGGGGGEQNQKRQDSLTFKDEKRKFHKIESSHTISVENIFFFSSHLLNFGKWEFEDSHAKQANRFQLLAENSSSSYD